MRTKKVDVIVAGGGTAGVIAGIAAAVLSLFGLMIIAAGMPPSVSIEEVDAQIRALNHHARDA